MQQRPTYTVDYTQDETGRWTARAHHVYGQTASGARVVGMSYRTASRLTLEDTVSAVYTALPDDAVLQVGTVREHPDHGLFGPYAGVSS